MRIGETFEFKGKSYVAREGEGCKGCAFLNEDCDVNQEFICISVNGEVLEKYIGSEVDDTLIDDI